MRRPGVPLELEAGHRDREGPRGGQFQLNDAQEGAALPCGSRGPRLRPRYKPASDLTCH